MGRGHPALRSVDSESQSHAIELRKANRGSLCFSDVRGHAGRHRNGLVPTVPPESTGMHGKRTLGFSRNSGSSGRLPQMHAIPAGDTGLTNSRLQRRTRPLGSEKNECTRRYRQTKATKCGGMGGRKS